MLVPDVMRELHEARMADETVILGYVRLAIFYGYSWDQIGDSLGVKKQTAWRRYRKGIDGTAKRTRSVGGSTLQSQAKGPQFRGKKAKV